jgi:hypothetical protein
LEIDSVKAQICADTQEEGFGLVLTWHSVNQHRREAGLSSVTRAAVIGLIQQLKPEISRVQKVSQGSRDINSNWSVARWLFSTQFLIKLGVLESQEITIKCKDTGTENTFIPDYWNKSKLSAINLSHKKETHQKCTIGGLSGAREHFLKFPRNENGELDINGTYSSTIVTQLKVKYAKEARLCLGVAGIPKDGLKSNGIVHNNEPKLQGCRLKPFIYSNKVILTIKEWKKKEEAEIKRIKSLNMNSYWLSSNRSSNQLYLDDKIDLMKGVGPSTFEKLKLAKIYVVWELLGLDDISIKEASLLSKLPISKIKNLMLTASDVVIHSNAPIEIDYRLAEDPYLAKFGPEGRMVEIKKSVTLSGNVCITDMIEHIYKESELLFKDTIHKDDWLFWHDALSLMTAKDTVVWMKEKGYYKRWILPELDLYKDFPEVKKTYND